MNIIDIASLLSKTGSMYKLVVLTSRRAIELGDGAQKLVDAPVATKPMNIAIEEIMQDKISYGLNDK